MDEFSASATQYAYVVAMYIDRLTELYGGYQGWIRQTGRPLSNTFLSDEEINEMFGPGLAPWARTRALFFWAGLSLPCGAGDIWDLGPSGREICAWHILAIQWAYEHPEAWDVRTR